MKVGNAGCGAHPESMIPTRTREAPELVRVECSLCIPLVKLVGRHPIPYDCFDTGARRSIGDSRNQRQHRVAVQRRICQGAVRDCLESPSDDRCICFCQSGGGVIDVRAVLSSKPFGGCSEIPERDAVSRNRALDLARRSHVPARRQSLKQFRQATVCDEIRGRARVECVCGGRQCAAENQCCDLCRIIGNRSSGTERMNHSSNVSAGCGRHVGIEACHVAVPQRDKLLGVDRAVRKSGDVFEQRAIDDRLFGEKPVPKSLDRVCRVFPLLRTPFIRWRSGGDRGLEDPGQRSRPKRVIPLTVGIERRCNAVFIEGDSSEDPAPIFQVGRRDLWWHRDEDLGNRGK